MAFKWRKKPSNIAKAYVEDNGKVALFMATQWAGLINKFVPLESGILRRAKVISINRNQANIVYDTPYARRQYFGTLNRGGGVTQHNFDQPLATHRWHDVGLRAGLGRRLLQNVAQFVRRVL